MRDSDETNRFLKQLQGQEENSGRKERKKCRCVSCLLWKKEEKNANIEKKEKEKEKKREEEITNQLIKNETSRKYKGRWKTLRKR